MGVIPHTPGDYPRYVHHNSKAPVLVHTKEEHQERRSQGYVDTYVQHDYPRHMYKNQHTRTVKSLEEEKALRAKGWSTKPGEHQLTTNPDGTTVPEEMRWLQGPDDDDDAFGADEVPEPVAVAQRKPRKVKPATAPKPAAAKKPAAKKKGAGEPAAADAGGEQK